MTTRTRRRILLMIPTLGFGGAETSFLHLKRILEAHHDVTVAVFEPCDPLEVRNVCSGPEFRYVDPPKTPTGRVRRWWHRVQTLRRWKQELGVDVAISFLEGADILNILTSRGEKTVVSIRGSKAFDPNIRGWQGWLRRHVLWPLVYRHADAVVGVSAGVLAEVTQLGFVGRGKAGRTIGLALQVDRLVQEARMPVEPQLEALAGRPIILSWGRISREKGYQHLLRVFAMVKQRVPAAQLLLVGSGPMYQEIARMAGTMRLSVSTEAELSAASDVILPGFRPSPIRYARVGGVFAFPSYSEGFPNAVVEALAAGLPVYANDGPWGVRCVLERNPRNLHEPFPTTECTAVDFGHLMPRIDRSENDACWAEALANALLDPASCDPYRAKALVRAMDFEEKNAAAAWLELLDELTASADASSPDATHPLPQGSRSVQEPTPFGSTARSSHVRNSR